MITKIIINMITKMIMKNIMLMIVKIILIKIIIIYIIKKIITNMSWTDQILGSWLKAKQNHASTWSARSLGRCVSTLVYTPASWMIRGVRKKWSFYGQADRKGWPPHPHPHPLKLTHFNLFYHFIMEMVSLTVKDRFFYDSPL